MAELSKRLRLEADPQVVGTDLADMLLEAADLIDRLPTTADGALILPGMKLWSVMYRRGEGYVLGVGWAAMYECDESPETATGFVGSGLYASRDNAEQARAAAEASASAPKGEGSNA